MGEREKFIGRFGDVYENTSWAIEEVYDGKLVDGIRPQDLVESLPQVIEKHIEDTFTDEQKLALLNSYPDLAGKLAAAKKLTKNSTEEHQGAGLDQCSEEELEEFTNLNTEYTTKFGFPFILAVTGHNRQGILAIFRQRLHNEKSQEIEEALKQVHKIAKIRIHKECNKG